MIIVDHLVYCMGTEFFLKKQKYKKTYTYI